jgi:TatD DNase family protein
MIELETGMRKLIDLPTLDAHCHLASNRPSGNLAGTGFAVALTLSLLEAQNAIDRSESHIAWGVGCYPRRAASQDTFDVVRFRELVERTAIVGEIGLDAGSKVPLERQIHNFRQMLEVVSECPRFVSIHSYRATGLVLKELRRTPVSTPVLHWWTGSAVETSEAVELGCYFSIHSAVARHSKFRTRVPPERILVESDHGYDDPPAAIPCRIEWVEHLVAQQLHMDVKEFRRVVWQNFASIIQATKTLGLLPEAFAEITAAASRKE